MIPDRLTRVKLFCHMSSFIDINKTQVTMGNSSSFNEAVQNRRSQEDTMTHKLTDKLRIKLCFVVVVFPLVQVKKKNNSK